jgi:endoribonuclease Dicer
MLPTGAGKTLIAAWLIKHYADALLAASASASASVSASGSGGSSGGSGNAVRWVVFICPTKLLVRQQAVVLRAATPLRCGEFTGDAGVDFWDGAAWAAHLAETDVLVATPQVVVDALAKSFLKASAWLAAAVRVRRRRSGSADAGCARALRRSSPPWRCWC